MTNILLRPHVVVFIALGDRIMLRERIPTVRFTAKECREKTADVMTEFLAIFN